MSRKESRTHAHLHWEYYRWNRRHPAAVDPESPTQICSDIRACSAQFC